MKHKKGRLVRAIIVLVIVGIGSWFFSRNLRADMNLDHQLGSGNQLVYNVTVAQGADEADSKAQVEKAVKVLTKRLKNFGATDCQVTVEGTKVTFNVVGIDNLDDIRSYLTKPGVISFRKSDDTQMMDASVLDEYALGVVQNGDSVLGYIYVSDTKTFGTYTASLALATDHTMAVWIDYTDDLKYKTESTKKTPAYLGANEVTSALSGNVVMTLAQSYDVASKLAVIVNSGSLANTVTEVSCNTLSADAGDTAFVTIFRDLLIGAAVVAVVMILSQKAIGLVGVFFSALYLAAVLFCTNALGSNFNTITILSVILAWVISLGGVRALGHDVRVALRKNHTVVNAVSDSIHAHATEWIDIAVITILSGVVIALIGTETIRQLGISIIIIGVMATLLVNFGTAWVVSDLAESGVLDSRKLLGVSDKEVIDVKSGQDYHYTNRFSKTDFASRDAKGYLPLLLLVIGLVGLILLVVNGRIALVNTAVYRILIIIVVQTLISYIYVAIRYHSANGIIAATLALLNGILAIGFVGLTGLKWTEMTSGAIVTAVAFGPAAGLLVITALNRRYKTIKGEKMTAEKIASSYNTEKAQLLVEFIIMAFITVVMVLPLIGGSSLIGYVLFDLLIALTVLLAAITYTGRQWLDNQKHLLEAPRNPKKKNKAKEQEEMTVFGINEIRHR